LPAVFEEHLEYFILALNRVLCILHDFPGDATR
jgi:hypothetical protein